MQFYDRLKYECKKQNIKLSPMLSEIGVSSGIITKWKSGTIPSGETLLKIAKRLNVSIDYLLTGAPNIADNEKSLLLVYSKLDDMNKARVLERAEMLLEEQEQQQTDAQNVG